MLLKAGNLNKTFGFHKTEYFYTFKNNHLVNFCQKISKNPWLFFQENKFLKFEIDKKPPQYFFLLFFLFLILHKVIPDTKYWKSLVYYTGLKFVYPFFFIL